MPAVLLLLFGILQTGIWLHARNVVANAALAAAEAQALAGAVPGAAQVAAESITRRASLSAVRVEVGISANVVDARVTGQVQLLVGTQTTVSAAATRHREEAP